MSDDALFLDVFANQSSLIKRLAAEFRAAARDFATDPAGYIKAVFKDHQTGHARRKDLLRFGMAIGLFVYATLFATTLLVWTLHARRDAGADKNPEMIVVPLRSLQPAEAPLARSDRDKDETGGGGGRHELTPASQGAVPLFEPQSPLIAPTTRPTLHEPVLPVMETLRGDPLLNDKRDVLAPTGLPDGVPGPPSDGPGANGGVGAGDTGGVGPGHGPGYGPGRNGGKGGEEYDGPGSRRQTEAPLRVDESPRALNAPRPNYTEEARANKAQGVVRARILVGSDGAVKQVRVVKGLPYGLNEEAIRAAMQMRFRPAMKDGVAVAYWMALDVEFNLR